VLIENGKKTTIRNCHTMEERIAGRRDFGAPSPTAESDASGRVHRFAWKGKKTFQRLREGGK